MGLGLTGAFERARFDISKIKQESLQEKAGELAVKKAEIELSQSEKLSKLADLIQKDLVNLTQDPEFQNLTSMSDRLEKAGQVVLQRGDSETAQKFFTLATNARNSKLALMGKQIQAIEVASDLAKETKDKEAIKKLSGPISEVLTNITGTPQKIEYGLSSDGKTDIYRVISTPGTSLDKNSTLQGFSFLNDQVPEGETPEGFMVQLVDQRTGEDQGTPFLWNKRTGELKVEVEQPVVEMREKTKRIEKEVKETKSAIQSSELRGKSFKRISDIILNKLPSGLSGAGKAMTAEVLAKVGKESDKARLVAQAKAGKVEVSNFVREMGEKGVLTEGDVDRVTKAAWPEISDSRSKKVGKLNTIQNIINEGILKKFKDLPLENQTQLLEELGSESILDTLVDFGIYENMEFKSKKEIKKALLPVGARFKFKTKQGITVPVIKLGEDDFEAVNP